MKFKQHSFRFAEQVLNSNLALKNELLDIITNLNPKKEELSRPNLNKIFDEKFTEKGWKDQPVIFENVKDPGAKLDFIKNRIGVEIQFGHSSFLGIDLLKFQTLSYSNPNLDKIDVGVYIVTTKDYQKKLIKKGLKWQGSLTFEKVVRYLPHFRSAIQVPIFLIGLDD
ncbi:MAG: BglII/BstYI family type II restriction endonuclease [Methanocellales archaeon]|nr:BglII/BstYI family type II restriction endonuclease [Methanocellales archaeon]MDD4898951.1 BglII/BstYI family type II restriction endonuclease [Methanocellales archaeon]